MSEAELLECLYRVGDDKYQGKGCAWMAWRLVGQAQPPDVGTTSCFDPKEGQTHLYKLGKGKLHDVVKLMANDYDGLVAANEPPAPEFSPRRVLKNYGDIVRVPEPSHQARHDLPRRQGLELRQAPAEKRGRVRALAEQGPLAAPQATPGRPVASGEPAGVAPSPTSDDRLRHQREHRELLVVQPRGPPEAATGLFRGPRRARDKRRTLIFYGNSGKGKTPGKLPGYHVAAMVARDVGLDEFVMVSSPDMLRSAVERNLLRDERPLLLDELQISSSNIGAQVGGVDTLKHLLGLSPDLPATIKCRYNDVKVPAETFRIITVQDLAKLHQREKRKFGSDKAISMAESLRALYFATQPGPAF